MSKTSVETAGEGAQILPPVKLIECVSYASGFQEAASPMWRVQIGPKERCFDFDTQAEADLLRRAVSEALTATASAPVGGMMSWRGGPFECPQCNCRSYARVDEKKPDGSFGPGPQVRCVDCKEIYGLAAPPQTAAAEGQGLPRCEVCDWPLATDAAKGCVPGNCSYRPQDGTAEARRIDARRAALARTVTPPDDGGERELSASDQAALEHEASELDGEGKTFAAEVIRKSLRLADSTIGPAPAAQPLPAGRERIAWIIDPQAYRAWHKRFEYQKASAQHDDNRDALVANYYFPEWPAALVKADTILAARPTPEQPETAGAWQLIETAPKDRDTVIDLVLEYRPSGRRWRETNCHWGGDWSWQSSEGRSLCGRHLRDDWGRESFDPLCDDEESTVATHWMLPEAVPTSPASAGREGER